MAELVKTMINGEFEITLPKHRAERPEWYSKKGWEKKRLQSMHEHLGPGDIIFYIGSEEGEMPALCQMWGAEVVMFEPNDKVWPNTKAIWDANKLTPPLATFSGFASDKTKGTPQLIMRGFPESAEGEVIHDHGFKELIEPGDIPQTEIDEVTFVIATRRDQVVTAISLDVEGSEWNVLHGAEKTLREFHPKIWLSLHPEFMFRMFGHYQYDLRKWIKDFGYTETLLEYEHEVHLFYE